MIGHGLEIKDVYSICFTSSYAISMSNSELIDQFRNFIDEKCKEKLNLIKYLHVSMIPSHWDYTFYVIWTVDLNRLFQAGILCCGHFQLWNLFSTRVNVWGHKFLLSFSPSFIFCIVIIISFIYLVIHFKLKICSKLSPISLCLYIIVIIIIIIIIVITNYYSAFYKTKFEQISWFSSKWNIAQTTLASETIETGRQNTRNGNKQNQTNRKP